MVKAIFFVFVFSRPRTYQAGFRRFDMCQGQHVFNRYKTMILDPSLFDLSSDDAIEALMEDAINDNLTREQTDHLDEYLNSTTDY